MTTPITIKYLNEAHFKNRIKKFKKKHYEEVIAVLTNFKNVMTYFEETNSTQLRTSDLVRKETAGIVAVDEKGCNKKGKYALRLYFFVTDDPKECYILTIGDKNTQEADNNFCKDMLKKAKLINKKI